MNQITRPQRPPSGVEQLKTTSDFLRGTLASDLASGGTQVTDDGYNLLKFFGSYEQHDRDTATARKQAGLEKLFSFMVRVRMPGGRLTAAQYLALDALADDHANHTLRITTRQGLQFHGIAKGDLKPAIAAINQMLLTTLAACGDVVRNVTTTAAPIADAAHARLRADAALLSRALLPKTGAYHEIFLDGATEPTRLTPDDSEPLYSATYLPRKFKIGLAHPADNTIDVLTNDLAVIARFEGERLLGYDLAIGGGLGSTHGRADTFPRLATGLGAIGPDDLLAAAQAVVAFQRDHGDRSDRRRARLKYVVEDRGIDFCRSAIETYLGQALRPAFPATDFAVPELLGWHAQGEGRFWLGVPVPSGRIGGALREALRAVVRQFGADPVMTPDQDLLLTNLGPADRAPVEALLQAHGVVQAAALTPLARRTLACPALPTCGLALTEAERVSPTILTALEARLAAHGLIDQPMSLRITGCPNGCARSYTGDLGLVGRVPGAYAIYVGGDAAGTRLAFKLAERVKIEALATTLDPLFAAYAQGRAPGEAFGDWCATTGVDALVALLPR